MKVIFIKDHLDWRAGDIIEATDKRADYWIKCNVVEAYVEKEKVEVKEVKEKAEGSPVTRKRKKNSD